MPRTKTLSDRHVVDATARVLLRLGPGRFTLSDVAREAGLSPATLVQRFGSKRGLMLAFAERAAASAADGFERAGATHASPLAALRAAMLEASEGLESRQQVANSLAVLLDDLTDEQMRAAATAHARTTQAAIRELLIRAIEARELSRNVDANVLALSVQAAWNGAIIQWALRGSGSFAAFLERVLAPLLPARASKARARKARSS
jgi:AcrR family transcriptional regulator